MKKNEAFPAWIKKYQTKGHVIRKKGASYQYFKVTSIRKPGLKNPQPVYTYLGVLKEDEGLVKAKQLIDTNPQYLEYGLTCFIYTHFKREISRSFKIIKEMSINELSFYAVLVYVHDVFSLDFKALSFIPNRLDLTIVEHLLTTRRKNTIMNISKTIDETLARVFYDDSLSYIKAVFRNFVIPINDDESKITVPNNIKKILDKYNLEFKKYG